MKKNFKRLFALLLTLCMLATLMVPAVFAEEVVETESPAVSANVAETYPIRIKDMTHTDPTTAEGIDALLVKTGSQTGTTYKQGLSLSDSTIVKAYPATLNWKYYANSGELIYRKDYMWQARMSGWGAIQIRVTKAGMYSLNVTTDRTEDDDTTENSWTSTNTTWTGNIVAYIIPLTVVNDAVGDLEATETETVEQLAIESLMIDDYCVGTVSVAADQTDITFAKTRMDAGEYVVVLDNGNQLAFSFSELSLLGDPYEMEEVASYALRPYDMTNTDPATYAGTYNADLIASSTTDEATGETTYTYVERLEMSELSSSKGTRYADLGWKYLTHSGAGNVRATAGRAWQPAAKTADGLVAIQINVPASGEMYLSLTTDKDTPVEGASWTNSVTSWTGDVTAWLVPLADYVDIATAAVDANCIGTKTLLTSETAVTFDKSYMEIGEYVFIYSASKTYYPVCELSLLRVAGSDLPESEKVTGTVATYDFELYEYERYIPMFGTTTTTDEETGETTTTLNNMSITQDAANGLEGVYEKGTNINSILNAEYKAGMLNWRFISSGNGCYNHLRGESQNGIRIQKPSATVEAVACWGAYMINVPATGYYTANIETESSNNCALNVYLLDASMVGDIAANLTEENKVLSVAKNETLLGFAAEFAAGDNIIVFQLVETTEKVTAYVSGITLFVPEETVSYNFGLSNDANFVAALREAVGDETAEPKDNTALKKWTYTVTAEDGTTSSVEFNPYTTIASLFAAGSMNWALDASSGTYADTLQADGTTYKYSGSDMQNFRGGESLRLCMETTEVSYAGLRILVPAAGTYNITTSFTSANATADLYLIKAPNAYSSYSSRLYAGHETRAALRDLIAVAEPFASTADGVAVGTYTFETAGEYILAIVQPEAKNTNLYLTTMVMEPAETNYIVDGAGYASFEAAVENATESIVLLQNTQAGELVVPAGVTLNLNGYMLYAASVDATAPGAQIVDAQDGKGLIRGEINFAEDNAQLPLYDIDPDGYRLYNVDVEAVTVTGKSGTPKYWFRVNFSNKAACDLIDATTELRIQADLTWDDMGDAVAVASADAAFSVAWASKYVANDSIYITVSAVNADDVAEFVLAPQVAANGVVISGEGMA